MPAEPRDSARLLDTRTMSDRRFADLPDLLRSGDLVVVNETRVRRARLIGRKRTGGKVELLLLGERQPGRWEALVKPARRVRVGTIIDVGTAELEVAAGPSGGRVVVATDADVESMADEVGSLPLPPYFKGTLADEARYQTVFGERVGSAAAPTAGLHFTPGLLDRLGEAGIEVAQIDLEVGLDTFRPISTATVEDHEMHSEQVRVEQGVVAAVDRARRGGSRVVAVGTTVARALETAGRNGSLEPFAGPTDLFITPGFKFRVIDLLITNFHVPGSTLVVLIAAVLGPSWRDVYSAALERGYRFLSFGDAMLAEVPR